MVGGSQGRGEVYEGGNLIGYADISQGSIGTQIGPQTFAQLAILVRSTDLAQLKNSEFTFAANASAVAIRAGSAATTDTGNGVVISVETKSGLMAEAAVDGQSLNFSAVN